MELKRFLPLEIELLIVTTLIEDFCNHEINPYRHSLDALVLRRRYTTAFRLVCKAWDDAIRQEIIWQLPIDKITPWSRDTILINEAVEALLKQHGPVDGSQRDTALHKAARSVTDAGCVSALKPLLDAGVSANTEWLLHWATWENQADVVRLLISYGADVNVRAPYHERQDPRTPLELAVSENNLEAMIALLDGGVKVVPHFSFQGFDCTLLVAAAQHQNLPMMAELLSRAKGAFGLERAARIAISRNDMEMLDLLLENGYSPTVVPAPDYEPLVYAIFTGHESIFRKLLDYGAPVSQGEPLAFAIGYEHLEMVRALLISRAPLTPMAIKCLTKEPWPECARLVLESYPSCAPRLLEEAIEMWGDCATAARAKHSVDDRAGLSTPVLGYLSSTLIGAASLAEGDEASSEADVDCDIQEEEEEPWMSLYSNANKRRDEYFELLLEYDAKYEHNRLMTATESWELFKAFPRSSMSEGDATGTPQVGSEAI